VSIFCVGVFEVIVISSSLLSDNIKSSVGFSLYSKRFFLVDLRWGDDSLFILISLIKSFKSWSSKNELFLLLVIEFLFNVEV